MRKKVERLSRQNDRGVLFSAGNSKVGLRSWITATPGGEGSHALHKRGDRSDDRSDALAQPEKRQDSDDDDDQADDVDDVVHEIFPFAGVEGSNRLPEAIHCTRFALFPSRPGLSVRQRAYGPIVPCAQRGTGTSGAESDSNLQQGVF